MKSTLVAASMLCDKTGHESSKAEEEWWLDATTRGAQPVLIRGVSGPMRLLRQP